MFSLQPATKCKNHCHLQLFSFCSSIFYVFFVFSRTFLASRQPPVAESARLPFQAASGGIPLHPPAGGGGGFIPSQPASQSRHPSPKPANQPASQSGCAFPQSASQLDPSTAANQWVLLMISCDFQISCNGHTSWLHRISVGFARGTLYDFVWFSYMLQWTPLRIPLDFHMFARVLLMISYDFQCNGHPSDLIGFTKGVLQGAPLRISPDSH